MTTEMIDLRSDTVTQPTAGMRKAMAEAEVGDDVLGADPTIAALESHVAGLLGMEEAVYMPSGSMTNQVAIRTHCKPGDEFICEAGCHIYNYEQAAFASLSGVCVRPVVGDFGLLSVADVEHLVRPPSMHCVRTNLLCLENTHNGASGRLQPYDRVVELCEWATSNSLRRHLDGARLFNAVAASGISAADWSQHFDTVSVCFSKGLGAPVGSALAGPAEMMREARRHRKAFGGAVRQGGIIAAGALYALEHHLDRLGDDHRNAQILAEAIRTTDGLTLQPDQVDTNIIVFRVDSSLGSAQEMVTKLGEGGIRCLPLSKTTVRFVTHMDVSEAQCQRAAEIIRDTVV